jgi:hypothetical protein
MNYPSTLPRMRYKAFSLLFLILFFGLGFLVTEILNTRIAKEPQNIRSRAQGLSPIQEAACTNQGGECQTGKADQVGKPCTLSDGATQGTVVFNLCSSQPDDVRCCVPNTTNPPVTNPPENVVSNVNTALSVKLQGIGANANPQNKIRTAVLKIFKNDGTLDNADYVAQDEVVYDSTSGNYSNSQFSLGRVPVGDYQMVIQMQKYLDKQLLSTQGDKVIKISGSSVGIASVELRVGDIAPDFRGDNSVNIIDYNALIGCLPGAPPGSCLNRDYADLNDDGKVDQIDLDLLLSNFGQNGFSFQTDEFKCEPDPACNTGKDSLQMCSLLCTRISKRS